MMLSACEVDASLFGHGKAKTVKHLLAELYGRESSLYLIEADGSRRAVKLLGGMDGAPEHKHEEVNPRD